MIFPILQHCAFRDQQDIVDIQEHLEQAEHQGFQDIVVQVDHRVPVVPVVQVVYPDSADIVGRVAIQVHQEHLESVAQVDLQAFLGSVVIQVLVAQVDSVDIAVSVE